MEEPEVTPRVRTVEADVAEVVDPHVKYLGLYLSGTLWLSGILQDTHEQARQYLLTMEAERHVIVRIDLREVMEA